MNNDDIKYDYWWAGMPRSFHSGVREIADAAGSAKRLYEMDKEELTGIKGISEKYAEDIIRKRREWDVDAEYEKLLRSGIRFIPWYDPEYPARLSDTAGAPFALFVYGDVPEDDRLSVALIGARNCSEYGRMTAEKFGCGLAEEFCRFGCGTAQKTSPSFRSADQYRTLAERECRFFEDH